FEARPGLCRPRSGVGEGSWEVGALVGPPAPALTRGEHVEMAGPRGRGTPRVVGGNQPIGAEGLVGRDACGPPLRGCEGARLHPCGRLGHGLRSASTTGSSAPSCSSWSAITDTSPLRLARMARWAALAPLIVVMQGM